MSANDEPILIEGRAFTNTENKANSRRKKAGLPPKYVRVSEEKIEARGKRHQDDLEFAQLSDTIGYYKSECRPCVELLGIYEGGGIQEKEDPNDDDDETGRVRKEVKKPKGPNPSTQSIEIPSFDRLGKEPDPAISGILLFRDWLKLRDKARKDLYWLCKLLGKDLYPNVHQVICDQFVQKDFDGMYHKGYTLGEFHRMIDAQKRFDAEGNYTKEMMLLDSRGFFKSTINGIDCISWHLNAPDAHIFILTGEYKLAVQFLQEIKDYYFLAKGAEVSAFQLLFPEYVLTGVAGRSKQPMKCPAKILKQKGHSLWVNAIVANLSGWHCDIKKGDDIVTDENSNTDEARESIKIKYDGTDDLLDPHGFSDHIGTRYFTSDWYGTRLTPDKESKELAPIKYFKRGCWRVKPEYKNLPITTLTEDMVDLTFPQVASFKKLRNKLLTKGERFFKNQQLNEPSDDMEDSGFKLSFTIETLRAHSYPKESAPREGEVFVAWDWAYSDKKTSDYSVGVAARVYQLPDGRFGLCVLDVVIDKWRSSELVYQIIAFDKKWNPKRTLIENSNGAELLKMAIMQKSQILGSDILQDVYWMPVSTQSQAKKNRVKSLETLLEDDRLHFVNGNWMDLVFEQLCRYTGEKSSASKKDDGPDAMAYLVEFLPKSALRRDVDPEEAEKEAEQIAAKERLAAWKKKIFGDGGSGSSTPPSSAPPASEVPPDPRRAAMNRIFGGNGMRA